MSTGLQAHLATGTTSVCRCWAITRKDGVVLGFTDHDRNLEFNDVIYKAQTGLTASAFQASTGLSVDNSEAIGALSDASLCEEDIEAGRYDGAELCSWLVNWTDVSERKIIYRGMIGELRRSGGQFVAELRGLAEALNRPMGRVYQKPCTAVLGDRVCRFDLDTAGYWYEGSALRVIDRSVLYFDGMQQYDPGWFQYGRLKILNGVGSGVTGLIRRDSQSDNERRIELWQPLPVSVDDGNLVRLEAGCDKRMVSCQSKFNNILNFQGFPDIPGDDFLTESGSRERRMNGGSRRQ